MTSFRPVVSRGDLIAGSFRKPRQPEGVLVRRSPGDLNDLVGEFPYARAGVEEAVQAARRALPGWEKLSFEVRAQALRAIQTEIRRRGPELARVIAREVGKPLWEAELEITAMIAKVEATITLGQRELVGSSLEKPTGTLRYKPLGVVAVLGTFCFPGHLSNGHLLPALLAGNTVVFKPSPLSPASGQLLGEIFHAARLPKGVFNLVQGDDSLGAALAAHPGVDVVCLTGSYQTGQKIKRATLDQPHKLLALEMGGKNAAIIDADAALPETLRECLFSAYITAGQRCSALSRILVHKKVEARCIEEFCRLAQKLRVGYPFDPDVFMGPLVSLAARDRFLQELREAEQSGAERLFGSEAVERSREGAYVRPGAHLLKNPLAAPRYAREELFGPDVSFQTFSDLEEALQKANDTDYGLALSYFGRKESNFEEVFLRGRAGIINWNRGTTGASALLPFGGVKQSGNFRPSGAFALRYSAYPVASLVGGGFFAEPQRTLPGFPGES